MESGPIWVLCWLWLWVGIGSSDHFNTCVHWQHATQPILDLQYHVTPGIPGLLHIFGLFSYNHHGVSVLWHSYGCLMVETCWTIWVLGHDCWTPRPTGLRPRADQFRRIVHQCSFQNMMIDSYAFHNLSGTCFDSNSSSYFFLLRFQQVGAEPTCEAYSTRNAHTVPFDVMKRCKELHTIYIIIEFVV